MSLNEEKRKRMLKGEADETTKTSLSVPASGHHASLRLWHNRSYQNGLRKTVSVEDKETHLGGFAANRCLFAFTKPRRGARATVASGSMMASLRRRGHRERKMACCQANITHICKQKPPYGEQNILDAINVLVMASPQGRDYNLRWQLAKRILEGIRCVT
ncbi:uncharacterized protein V6R79_024999 [Siganus canaliculatus]